MVLAMLWICEEAGRHAAVRRRRKRIVENALHYKTCFSDSDDSNMLRAQSWVRRFNKRKEVIRCLMVQQWGRFSSFGGRTASFIGMTAGGILPQSTLPSIEAAVRMVSRAGTSGR